jgi:hypothetical protein
MNEQRNVKLRDALLRALAIATFTAVSATAFTPVAQARVLLDEVNDSACDLGDDNTGDGTADDPYRISTVEDLAEVGDCDYDGDYYYSLVNDLDISPDDNYNNDDVDWNTTDGGWEPIGEYHSEDFSGHFDGNGHTISGLEIDNNTRSDNEIGLFSSMEDAVIKNLTIIGEIDADGYDSVGILAGDDTDSVVTNVHIHATITDGDQYVGGLIGYASGTRMSNITTTGSVAIGDADEYVGGIVGYVTDSVDSEPSLIDSSSDVNVNDPSIEDNDYEYAGGIVGYSDDLRMVRVSYDGTVTGTDYVGGLVGDFDNGLIHDSVVTEDAEIVVTPNDEDANRIGGVVGSLDSGTISSSSFHGKIDAYMEGYDVVDLGGIAGYAGDAFLVNDYVASSAQFELRGNGDLSFSLGGIVGFGDETSISGVAMNADLSAIDIKYVGGIAGGLDDSQLDSSVNRGNVTVTLDDASFDDDYAAIGGLVGDARDGVSVTNSTNKGDVASNGDENTYGVGGIAGIAYWAVVTDNYNTGDVEAPYNVGGVVGMLTENGAVVQRNFSLGELTGYDSDPDGIATLEEEEVVPPAPQPIGDGGDLSFDEPSNVVLLSDASDNITGATEMTAIRLKTESELVDLGWLVNDADRADWTIDAGFNNGFPHLAWETASENIDEEVGLLDFTFEEIITFLGAKRKSLRTSERNALNEVVELVGVNAYDSVDVHVYYGTKRKLAEKRGLNVKRWLVRQGVAQTITVYVHPTDNNNPIGSVTIEALVD